MKRARLKRTSWRKQPRAGNTAGVTKRHKWGVAPPDERIHMGVLYASKLEMRYAAKLELLRQAIREDHRVVDVQRQVSVKLEVNGCLICRYIVDFVVTYADGRVEWVELKGAETPDWKIKANLFRALFPERRYLVVKNVR